MYKRQGYNVSSVHLRWIHPFHPKLEWLLKRFKKVIVPEMNLGQLVRVLRAEFLVDCESLTKMQGKPFKVSEICAKIESSCTPAS